MPLSWQMQSFAINGRRFALFYEQSEAYVGPCSAIPSLVTDPACYEISGEPKMHGDFTGRLVI